MTDPMFNIYSKGGKVATYRVPLDDICAGPKCRFFATPPTSYAPLCYWFYDRKEQRAIGILRRKRWRLFFHKTVETDDIEPYYHVILSGWRGNPVFCRSYQCSITNAAWREEKMDTSYSEKVLMSSCTNILLVPIEELVQYRCEEAERQWQDGAKCPSFLPYPIAT